jgi:ParB-like chromosome segregation protein Spo0J
MDEGMAETANWRNRIVRQELVDPRELKVNPANWRLHPKEQQSALRGALSNIGWVQNVIVNERTGRIVDGHARVAAATNANEPVVPVVYVDLTEEEELTVLTTLDPIGALATADQEMLDDLVGSLTVNDNELASFMELMGSRSFAQLVTDGQLGRLSVETRFSKDIPDADELFTGSDKPSMNQKLSTHQCPSCGFEWSDKIAELTADA